MRLQWHRGPDQRLFAYPEGKDQPLRFARIEPYEAVHGTWRWCVACDGASISGMTDSTQAAADRANEAWPLVIEKAGEMKARADWEAEQLELVEKVKRGELAPTIFADRAAQYENLMWVMDRVRHPPWHARVKLLIASLSEEFFRRRIGR